MTNPHKKEFVPGAGFNAEGFEVDASLLPPAPEASQGWLGWLRRGKKQEIQKVLSLPASREVQQNYGTQSFELAPAEFGKLYEKWADFPGMTWKAFNVNDRFAHDVYSFHQMDVSVTAGKPDSTVSITFKKGNMKKTFAMRMNSSRYDVAGLELMLSDLVQRAKNATITENKFYESKEWFSFVHNIQMIASTIKSGAEKKGYDDLLAFFKTTTEQWRKAGQEQQETKAARPAPRSPADVMQRLGVRMVPAGSRGDEVTAQQDLQQILVHLEQKDWLDVVTAAETEEKKGMKPSEAMSFLYSKLGEDRMERMRNGLRISRYYGTGAA